MMSHTFHQQQPVRCARHNGGMNAANRPGDCSLDRRGGPDDRARPPQELLDNLRLRLSRLADNHPSAPGYQEQPVAGDADAAAGQEGESADGENGHAGVFENQEAGTDARSELPAASDNGSADGAGTDAAGPPDAVRTAAAAVASGLGMLATMELPGRGRHLGDPYRPWFMAGEPGSPWWSGTLY